MEKGNKSRNVSVIKDAYGNSVVVINVCFTGIWREWRSGTL